MNCAVGNKKMMGGELLCWRSYIGSFEQEMAFPEQAEIGRSVKIMH